ncbi:MAG: hypothetical protein N4A35_04045 [Flavobacteriales bacterium]|jgi:hypothetical protein|nr:hypothetical protein [Flavobacteriales bacterium]
MIKQTFIALILLIFSYSSITWGQEDTLTAKQIRAMRAEMAKEQIKELKNGVLLVQLKTRQKTIDAYLKKGLEKKANKVQELQQQDNLNIIKGFHHYFNFCPVYFYTSKDYKNVKAQNFSAVTFYDSLMNPQKIAHDLNNTNYYICEISKNNYSNSTLNNIPNFSSKHDNSIKFDAFIIKNKDFQQLSSPFPYYAKTHVAVKVKDKKRWEAIRKINYRLHTYYKSDN